MFWRNKASNISKRLAFVAWMLVLLLLSPGSSSAQVNIRVALDARYEAHLAPLTFGVAKGFFQAEGLEVVLDPAASSREALAKIAAGGAEMGIVDINALIRSHDENANGVKAVMMLHDRPAYAIIGRKSRGISRELSSLQGKKFGAPAGDSAYLNWPVMKTVNNIDSSSMKFEAIGQAVREPILASGEIDAVFGLTTSSYVNLKSRGVPVEDIIVLPMSEYGVDLYGSAIVASTKFIAENPEAVRAFLRAYLRAVWATIENPSAAVDSVIRLMENAKKEAELEKLSILLEQNIMTPWVKANGYGGIDPERFARAIDQIAAAGGVKKKPKPDDIFTDQFLPDERALP